MKTRLYRLVAPFFVLPLLAVGTAAQDPECCVMAPDGVGGVRVDEAPIPTNLREIADSLQANRPPALDGASSTRTAVVWVHVGADGSVLETRIDSGSGSPAIDATFRRIASVLRFSPAMLANSPIAVWIRLPFTIQVGRPNARTGFLDAGVCA